MPARPVWTAKMNPQSWDSTTEGGDAQQEAAVAESPTAGGGQQQDAAVASSIAGSSIRGDTIASSSGAESGAPSTAVAARRAQRVNRRAPREPHQGERKTSSVHNSDWEVVNVGLFVWQLGNAKLIAHTIGKTTRQERQDAQILKCSGQVIVLAEATQEIEDLLRRGYVETAVAGRASRLDERTAHEHWVIRGNEDVAVLIAARKDNTTSLECLNYLVNDDHEYREHENSKWRGLES